MKARLGTARSALDTLSRVGRYAAVKTATLLLAVAAAAYLTILVANLGGYMDKAVKAQIDKSIGYALGSRGNVEGTREEKLELFEKMTQAAYEAAGLNEPFVARCFRWLGRGLTLNWGETSVDSVSWGGQRRPIRAVVLDNLPRTLLIFGSANVLLFLATVVIALPLTRRHAGWVDGLVMGLSPLSAAPAWVYGIVLNLLFLRLVGGWLSGGAFDTWPGEFQFAYIPQLLRHLALPTAAIFVSGLFQGVYTWRTLFLLHADEDYVETAKAKGLPARVLERRYILRPLLPSLMTGFALLFVTLWQEVIVLEHFFNVAGIGRLLVRAMDRVDTPVIVALVVTFAYLTAITVFLLDILYALVDPRVRVGGRRKTGQAVSKDGRPGLIGRLSSRVRGRSGSAETGSQPTAGRKAQGGSKSPSFQLPSGSEALRRILGDFVSAHDVPLSWLAQSASEAAPVADRLYPELGLAVHFGGAADGKTGAVDQLRRREGIVPVELVPDQPVSAKVLRRIHGVLGAAARRVAQRRGSSAIKVSLMPRIAGAKSACLEILATVERGADSRDQTLLAPAWKVPWGGVRARAMSAIKVLLWQPAAALGLFIIAAMMGVSLCTVVALPYDEMIAYWREGDDAWATNPKSAGPAWSNLFRRRDLPTTIAMKSHGAASTPTGEPGGVGVARKTVRSVSDTMTEIMVVYPFDYQYDGVPQDLFVRVNTAYDEKKPLVILTWVTPQGREVELDSAQVQESYAYRLSLDDSLDRTLGEKPLEALFGMDLRGDSSAVKGAYELQVKTFVFEENVDVDSEFVLYGQVHGLAGTDARRRDLLVPLLWGMPVALAFGILAAVGTSVSSMILAAIGTWFGGWVDGLVQRVTEVNMILPFLPVSILVFTLYSKSFWAILGVTVLLSVFGTGVKTYRAVFLQVKEAPYIEAARAYGAGNWRIVLRYLVPRIAPVLIPQLIVRVPSYVFLEATLASLGVSDPVLPTWGKLMVEGLSRGILTGDLHLLLEPLGLLALVAFAFVLLGSVLERVLQPRLRAW